MTAQDTAGLVGSLGWIFMNPDTGIEWAEQHPVESGECPDAQDIQPGYAVHLHHHLIAAWEDARAYADAAKTQRLAKEAAERLLSESQAEGRRKDERIKALEEALAISTNALDGLGNASDAHVSPEVWRLHGCEYAVTSSRTALAARDEGDGA